MPDRPTGFDIGMYKDLSRGNLAVALAGVQELYVSGCSAEIVELPGMLAGVPSLRTVTGIFSPILNRQSYADAEMGRRCRTFFLNGKLKEGVASGLVDLSPWSYSQISHWMTAAGRFDAAVVMVSPPDADGRCSFGVQADFLPDFHGKVPRLIGVINPNMPATFGEPGIPVENFYALFNYDRPLLEFVAEDTEDAESDAIGAHIAGIVRDGATVQMGIGRVPQAVARSLTGHRGLRIHSGLIDSNTPFLEQAGALSPDSPIVGGSAMGSAALYSHIDDNQRYALRATSYTHSSDVIAAQPNFMAINGALQVDLLGQVNSEGISGRLLATPGGLPDFLDGVSRSAGGKSIFAVRAKPGRKGQGGIVGQISAPGIATVSRTQVDIIVTENGPVELKNLSLDQRAEALISIADLAEQSRLTEEWRTIRAGLFS